jgi:hypothetical protein
MLRSRNRPIMFLLALTFVYWALSLRRHWDKPILVFAWCNRYIQCLVRTSKRGIRFSNPRLKSASSDLAYIFPLHYTNCPDYVPALYRYFGMSTNIGTVNKTFNSTAAGRYTQNWNRLFDSFFVLRIISVTDPAFCTDGQIWTLKLLYLFSYHRNRSSLQRSNKMRATKK